MTTLTDTQVVTASGGLVELGYLSYNAGNVAVTSGNNSYIGGSLTCVCDGSPVVVDVFVPRVDMGASSDGAIVIEVDGVSQGRCLAAYNPNTGGSPAPTYAQIRITPAAGSHTFRMRAYTYSGTLTYLTGGGVFPDAYLRVSKIVTATQWPAVTTGTIICTSSTRPASPFEGQTIYETDTDLELRWTGSAWVVSGSNGGSFLSASSTTTVSAASAITYTQASITLTPGVWEVQAAMALINGTTTDSAAVAIYNQTTSAVVSGSYGTPGYTSTTWAAALQSMPTKMTVTSNTQVCPYGNRNGGSTVATASGVGAPVGLITARRLYGG